MNTLTDLSFLMSIFGISNYIQPNPQEFGRIGLNLFEWAVS